MRYNELPHLKLLQEKAEELQNIAKRVIKYLYEEPSPLIAINEPKSEAGVVYMFSRYHDYIDFYNIEMKTTFPDAIAIRNGKKVRIEFEYKSKNFIIHGHDINKCDIIVCWVNDWIDCPLEVIELKSQLIPAIVEKREKRIQGQIVAKELKEIW